MTSLTKHNGSAENGHPEMITPGRSPEPALSRKPPTLGDLRVEAERLINAMNRPVRRVSLRAGENTVEVDWEVPPEVSGPAAGPRIAATRPEHVAGEPALPDETAGTAPHRVSAPLVGTVYLAPEPGAALFVRVGDTVTAGQQLAIIEAMKLMNPIIADQDGVVTSVLAKDGEMVEFGEALFELSCDDDQGGE